MLLSFCTALLHFVVLYSGFVFPVLLCYALYASVVALCCFVICYCVSFFWLL